MPRNSLRSPIFYIIRLLQTKKQKNLNKRLNTLLNKMCNELYTKLDVFYLKISVNSKTIGNVQKLRLLNVFKAYKRIFRVHASFSNHFFQVVSEIVAFHFPQNNWYFKKF